MIGDYNGGSPPREESNAPLLEVGGIFVTTRVGRGAAVKQLYLCSSSRVVVGRERRQAYVSEKASGGSIVGVLDPCSTQRNKDDREIAEKDLFSQQGARPARGIRTSRTVSWSS